MVFEKVFIKSFIENNPKTVLLDVRTEDEWNTIGKPDTKDLGIESVFITISQDPSFLDKVKQSIDKKKTSVGNVCSGW